MCGILGFVRTKITTGLFDSDLASMFTDGMLVGSLRGMDSFGYMTCNGENVRTIKKYPVAAPLLYGTPVFDEMKARAKHSQIVVGHHRAKTTGVISEGAAHPYIVQSEDRKRLVWGVHNGSLVGWNAYKNGRNFQTDSEYLFTMIADHGPEALKDIDGAYAVAFMMSDHPGKLFLARNKDRPLAYTITPDSKALLFSSEPEMLGWLASRAPYRTALNDKFTDAGHPWADVMPYNLYTIDMNDVGKPVVEECLKPTPKKPYTPPSSSVVSYNKYPSTSDNDKQTIEALKKKYPTATETEIDDAHTVGVLGEEVDGIITKLRYATDGTIKYGTGYIISTDNHTLEELKFHLRVPGKEWQSVLEGVDGDAVGIRFKVGGVMMNPKHNDMSVVVGELRYVFSPAGEVEDITTATLPKLSLVN